MRAGAGAFDRVVPWIAVGAALAYFLHEHLALGGPRQPIALCAALLVAGVLVRRRDARSTPASTTSDVARRALRATAVLLPVSVAIAVARALLIGDGTVRSAIVAALVPVLLGWSIFLLLPLARPGADGVHEAPRSIGAARIVGAIVAATIAVLLVRMRLVDHWTSIDEVIYSLQAHLFLHGDYRWHLDPDVQRFFTPPLMAPTARGPYTQYPPGYPAILTAFLAIGVPWASGAALGAIAITSTYLLGRRCASAFVGVMAAALLAAHFLFLDFAAHYYSHVAAMAAIASAAWLALSPPSSSPRRRVVEMLLSGLLMGVAVTIRPVTGIALGLSLWLWLLSRRGWRAMGDTTLLLGLGAAIPCVALMLYNALTNGSPFRFGYSVAQGHLNDLGFGMRGLLLHDARGERVLSPQPFAVADALRLEAVNVLWPLMRDVTPVFTVLPLLAAAYAYRMRARWRTIAAFGVLPLVNFFYFANGVRLYLELLPFAVLGIALIVAHVWASDATAGRALTIFLIGASVASSATRTAADERQRVRHPSDGAIVMRQLLAARRTSGPMLVFVRNPPLVEPLFIALTPLNFSPFPGPIAVARDLGSENERLVCRMPGRTVMIAEASTDEHGARLLPTQPDSARGTACRASTLSPLTR